MSLVEGYPPLFAELEEGEEADDDLDAGREVPGQLAERRRAGPRKPQGQLGDGISHRDGVDGHMVEIDHGSRPFGGGAHEGSCHMVRCDPLEQVWCVDHQVGVEAGGTGDRPGCLLDEQGKPVGRGGIGLALEEAGEEQVPLFPADELFVGLDVAAAGQEAAGLQLDKHRRHDQELRQRGKVDLGPGGDLGHERIDDVRQRNVEDVHLVAGDQLQERIDGALVCGDGDGSGHRSERYRVGAVALCTRPSPVPGHRPRAPRAYDDALMARVLSGIQPSGDLHLGNYLGAIRNWVEDQGSHDAFYCVVDLHALTLDIDPAELRSRTHDTALDLLAAGLDPDRCTLFVQSHVVQHTQMAWLLECTATMGELQRMTQFKDKSAGKESVRVGLFTYPVLQAADIVLYDAERVPVGDDQRQHLELARDVAIRFNGRFGDVLVVPEASIPVSGARVMDLQHPERKMSKSVNSPLGTVLILDDPAEITRKVKKAVTDNDGEVRFDPEAKPGLSNLLELLAVATGRTPKEVAGSYERYGDLKKDTAEALIELLRPVQTRRAELASDPGAVASLLSRGADKATEVASATYDRAARAVGLLAPA